MFHSVTRLVVEGTEHEHGSHYATPCIEKKLVCSCGVVLYKGCYAPFEHSQEYMNMMMEHRLDYLERHCDLPS